MTATPLSLLVRVLQDVVSRERFDSESDLKEAFKSRLSRLKIAYDAGLVSLALDQLERGGRTPLVTRKSERIQRRREPQWQPEIISRAEAIAMLERISA